MRTLLLALTRPRKLAEAVSEGPAWVMPLLILSVLEMGVAFLLYDQTVSGVIARLPEGASTVDKIALEKMFRDERMIEILFKPFRLAAGCALFSLVIYGLLHLFFVPVRPRFHHVFSLAVHAELILILGRAGTYLRSLLGSSGVPGMPFSLNDLFPPTSFLESYALGSFSLFHLWSMVVLMVGIVGITKMRPLKAAAVVLISWMLTVAVNAWALHSTISFFHFGL